MPKFKIAQIVVRHGGKLAALTTTGEVVEQFTDRSNPAQAVKWRPVDKEGLEDAGRIVHIAAQGERLIAVNSRGQVFAQANDGSVARRGLYAWRKIDVIEDEPAA